MYILYPPPKKNWVHHGLSVLVLLMIFPLTSLGKMKEPNLTTTPPSKEESHYHALTLEIQQTGGILNFLKGFYQGRSNTQDLSPLYPLVLMSVAQTRPEDFASNARALNFILVLTLLFLLFWTLRRTEGEVFGLLAIVVFSALLFATHHVTEFGPHWLSALCAYVGWFNLVEETDQEAQGTTAGLWFGAAFLTSELGALLTVAAFVVLLVQQGVRLFVQKKGIGFFLGWSGVASPILVRDFWLTGNPFSHFIQSMATLPALPSAEYFELPLVLVFGLIALAGIVLDSNRSRQILSLLYLVVLLFWIRRPQASFVVSFYSAALLHTGLQRWLGNATLWIAFALAAGLCGGSWYFYLLR